MGWLDALVISLPNAIAAIVVIIIFFILAKLARRATQRVLDRFSRNANMVHSVIRILIWQE